MAISAVAASKRADGDHLRGPEPRIHGDKCRGCIKAAAPRACVPLPCSVSMAISAVAASKQPVPRPEETFKVVVSMATSAVAASKPGGRADPRGDHHGIHGDKRRG